MKKKFLHSVAAILMVSLLAGCGGGASATGTTAVNQNAQGTAKTEAAAPEGEVKNSVIVACASEGDCFYPYHTEKSTNQDEVPVLHNVYDSLLKLTPENGLEPLIATEWSVSEDALTYTIKLRKGVTFSNGYPMTAEDVKFSLDSAVAIPAGKSMLANYESTEIVDDYTIKIHLSSPYAAFPNVLSSRYALIVSKQLFEEIGQDSYDAAPVGTGPYKFIERVSGSHISMTANENYWGGELAIKDVKLAIMTDTNTQLISLENGDIDVLISGNPSILSKITNDNVTYITSSASSIIHLRFNCAEGPGKNLEFRKAVQSAINREDLNIGVLNGMAEIGDTPAAPGFSGRPDDGTYTPIIYDVEKAKEHLAASGYNGEEFVIICNSGTKDELAAQIVQGQLMEIGINCTVNAVDAASYAALGEESGEYGARLRYGGVSALDADGAFTFQYYSDSVTANGAKHQSMAYSDELDALIEQGRGESDPEKRKEIYAKCTSILNENVYGITLYYDVNAAAFNKNLQGIDTRAIVALYYINDWSWN